MSAGDSLSNQQFFHASDHEFQPGEKVLSPRARDDLYGGNQMSADPDSVFMTGSRAGTKGWGKHIYQVQPEGDVQSHKWGYNVHTAKSATVIREIHDKRLK
jgi:hypothetical protein